MNEKEFLDKLKNRLEKKADEIFNFLEDDEGLYSINESDLVDCIADIFKEEGFMCFFESKHFEPKKDYEKKRCDLVAVSKNKDGIWIECKLMYVDDRRLYKKNFEGGFLYDIKKLKAITDKNAKEKYYMILTISNYKDLNKLPTKRVTGKLYSIREALHLCGFKEDSWIEVVDNYSKNDEGISYFYTLQILKVK